MVDTPLDTNSIREEEFDQLAVYLVPDQPSDENCESRTESSLPRNLVLRPSHTLTDVSFALVYSSYSSFEPYFKKLFVKSKKN